MWKITLPSITPTMIKFVIRVGDNPEVDFDMSVPPYQFTIDEGKDAINIVLFRRYIQGGQCAFAAEGLSTIVMADLFPIFQSAVPSTSGPRRSGARPDSKLAHLTKKVRGL